MLRGTVSLVYRGYLCHVILPNTGRNTWLCTAFWSRYVAWRKDQRQGSPGDVLTCAILILALPEPLRIAGDTLGLCLGGPSA